MRPESVVQDLLPVFPEVARELLPELSARLTNRVTARLIREIYVPQAAR